jgi:hypothetical protein
MGKARAKEAAATTTTKDMFQKLRKQFENVFQDDNSMWDEGPRGMSNGVASNYYEPIIEQLIRRAINEVNDKEEEEAEQFQKQQSEFRSKAVAQYETPRRDAGAGKSFSPGVIKLGRHTCRY